PEVTRSGATGNVFQYVPMATEATPVSLAMLATAAATGAVLLGRPALPLRAKGIRYLSGTGWHRDSELPFASLGFLAYLDPLDAATGALRVVPGSHRIPLADPPTELDAGVAVETQPGDLIVLDDHVLHASRGGEVRRQWRVDVIADPRTEEEVALVQRYLDDTFEPGWDGGYDVDRFPSFGPDWRAAGGPWVARLEQLGAPARARAEEDAARRARGI
ncbi:MAG TPA: phytanoyl-CoA dioxygenase family protein, partial [Acidimicrobiales bacterium]|nr:phytanoyl-CoA dioxygenase family protein [Acidimicrobiales bacterium]